MQKAFSICDWFRSPINNNPCLDDASGSFFEMEVEMKEKHFDFDNSVMHNDQIP